eukprot:6168197-Pleurochrysis_carterae.AAC.1
MPYPQMRRTRRAILPYPVTCWTMLCLSPRLGPDTTLPAEHPSPACLSERVVFLPQSRNLKRAALAKNIPLPRNVQRMLESSLFMKMGKQVLVDETADSSDDDCAPVNARAATAAAASGAASAPAKSAPSAAAADGRNVNVDSMSGSGSTATVSALRCATSVPGWRKELAR